MQIQARRKKQTEDKLNQRSALCPLPSTIYLLPAASTFYLLPSTFYFLPSTFYLLHSACFLLPSASTCYLLPFAFCLRLQAELGTKPFEIATSRYAP